MHDTLDIILLIREKFEGISEYLNEKTLRVWCATEAKNHNKIFGTGGITVVHQATGVSQPTIRAGMNELKNKKKQKSNNKLDPKRIRRAGGGRKKITEKHPDILKKLDSLVEPFSRGDPESALRWTCKSVRNLTQELNKKGYKLGFRTVCDLLETLKYSLQANQKTKEGRNHPDRDRQFRYINRKVKKFQKILILLFL